MTLARLWTLLFCLKRSTDKSLHQNIALRSQWEQCADVCDPSLCPLQPRWSISAALVSQRAIFTHRIQRQPIRANRNNMWIQFCGGVRLKELTAPGTFSRHAGGSLIKAASVQTALKSLQKHPANIWMSRKPGASQLWCSQCFANTDQILQEDDSTSKLLIAFIMINTEPVWK